MTWLENISAIGAHCNDGVAVDFGDAVAERAAVLTGTVVAPLAGYGVLRFSGADATTFLHGQVSCDLKSLPENTVRLGGYSTPKGRMLASPLFWQQQGTWYAVLPRPLCEPIRKRLAMYIMRSKVVAEDISDQLALLGLAGPGAAVLASHSPTALQWHENLWLLPTAVADVASVWEHCCGQARAVGEGVWQWRRICAGLPMVLPATQEQFVPQMANLDLLDGISYTKGCYPGQEIVARTHYLGKVKRRMALFHSDSTLAVGDNVYSPATAQQACGMVAAVEAAATGGWDTLVVAQLDAHGDLHLHGPDGLKLQPQTLPYVVA